MGGMNSCCIPHHINNDVDISTTTSTPKKKGHSRNLSETFNLSVIDDPNRKIENSLVNINSATEEELMTLPGISRATARNIIDYRNHIGGFKCIEDVALASGVGAAKLSHIRGDIYVSSTADPEPKSVNGNTTLQQNGTTGSKLIVSVNSANVFSLIKVKGIDMTMAKNIVAYREKHGLFKSIEDLLKIKGIAPNNLDVIRSFLTLEVKQETSTAAEPATNGVTNKAAVKEKTEDYIRRSTSSLENLLEILGPLAKVPDRPSVEAVALKHNNRNVFRLSSWNLEKFSSEKASNPGVKDVVCMTILENGFGILAVQEIADKKALTEICKELNSPTLPNVKKWKGRRGQWDCVVSEATGRMHQSMEYNGFLYDKSQGIELIKSCLIEKSLGKNKVFTRSPFVGIFKIKGIFDCVVVSVHLKATGLHGEDMDKTEKEVGSIDDMITAIKEKLKGEEDIIIVGDFNLGPEANAYEDLQQLDYVNCIPADTFTNISNNKASGSKNYDNIWISKQTQKVYTGVSGVVREGLSSTWIPNGWSWGGVVSDHCPVYTQLYADKDLDKGNLPSKDDELKINVSAISK
ncbi:endonuclease/exonuclease/phosphatase family domain-containing protein 1-like [Physella acuta]|uniref:endonuclease/exonuclease/phosphatase family domain-containing protein 1-like n=1 Tax=Physella acuta TaxID=109671 RepID=UPI0027DD5C32|nr:endonuclease/exonuclease/phosphatase family domain-containing protein 1-like [Physella acuta]